MTTQINFHSLAVPLLESGHLSLDYSYIQRQPVRQKEEHHAHVHTQHPNVVDPPVLDLNRRVAGAQRPPLPRERPFGHRSGRIRRFAAASADGIRNNDLLEPDGRQERLEVCARRRVGRKNQPSYDGGGYSRSFRTGYNGALSYHGSRDETIVRHSYPTSALGNVKGATGIGSFGEIGLDDSAGCKGKRKDHRVAGQLPQTEDYKPLNQPIAH